MSSKRDANKTSMRARSRLCIAQLRKRVSSLKMKDSGYLSYHERPCFFNDLSWYRTWLVFVDFNRTQWPFVQIRVTYTRLWTHTKVNATQTSYKRATNSCQSRLTPTPFNDTVKCITHGRIICRIRYKRKPDNLYQKHMQSKVWLNTWPSPRRLSKSVATIAEVQFLCTSPKAGSYLSFSCSVFAQMYVYECVFCMSPSAGSSYYCHCTRKKKTVAFSVVLYFVVTYSERPDSPPSLQSLWPPWCCKPTDCSRWWCQFCW